MEKNNELEFDELLTKYIDGVATEEEENKVLDYVAENEECMDEMMQIAESIRVQHESGKKQHKTVVAYRVAASVALLLVAGGIWLALGGNTNNGGEMLAQNNVSNNPTIIFEADKGGAFADSTSTGLFESHSLSVGNNKAELQSRPISVGNESETANPSENRTKQDTSVSQIIPPARRDGTPVSHMASLEVVPSNKEVPSGKRLLADYAIPTEWPKGADLEIKWTSNADKVTLTFISVEDEKDTREVKGSQGSFVYPAAMREKYLRQGSVLKCILTASNGTDVDNQSGIIKLTGKK